ncbi:MAG: carboxylating nicotinate-nucleotide diphosphorylase [Aquificae bacterium]|nr:carboxylating nicotinate-nucleotide diphosphorylase [Aquificota bacterium]
MREKLREFLEEDLLWGDLTTDALVRGESVSAVIVAKGEGVLAGGVFVDELFGMLGGVRVEWLVREGEPFGKGTELARLFGDAGSILKGERLALNILQRLSGIALTAKRFSDILKEKNIYLLDTRKTTPGFRFFEKYAVRVGGGKNHRFGLFDMVLIKDNHKRVAGGLEEALRRVRERVSPVYKVEVEVESIGELEVALGLGVDMVMLDNFSPEEVREAVALARGKVLIEVSGNITLENVNLYAIEGVNFISAGCVTHSSRWVDISLRIL